MKIAKILEPFCSRKIAEVCLNLQAESAKDRLIYENEIEWEGHTFFYLNELAIGAMWEIGTIPHEILDKDHLTAKMASMAKLFELVNSDAISFQFIYACEEGSDLEIPGYFQSEDKSFAQKLLQKRYERLISGGLGRKMQSRKAYLTLRLEMEGKVFDSKSRGQESGYLQKSEDDLKKSISELGSLCDIVEYQIKERIKLPLRRCGGEDLLWLVRRYFSDTAGIKIHESRKSFYRKGERLADQVVRDFIKFKHDGIAVGQDYLEVLSWADKADAPFIGMLTELLNPINLNIPATFILNIRGTNDRGGLSSLIQATKNGGDAYKERQYLEAVSTEDRIERGEKLLPVSFHVLVRNENLPASASKNDRGGQRLARKLSSCIDTPLFVEKFSAFPIFMSCLPLGYSKKLSGFIKREYRVLSSDLPAYIPIYRGSNGDTSPGMLMLSRSDEPIWIDPRASHTNPHVAVLGESGSGKSFFLSNLIVSDLAKHPDEIIFHIDNIASSEFLVKAIGEEKKVRIIKPPGEFPAIFRGQITQDRIPTFIDILSVAAELVSETRLSATEKVVLGESIIKAYEASLEYSRLSYVTGSEGEMGSVTEKSTSRKILRLSDVLNVVPTVCAEKGLPEEIGANLWNVFAPFIGTGPYTALFDQERVEDQDSETPTYSLYDLQGIASDKAMRTLTTLLITSEIMYELSKPENSGKKGMLIIDELGVNLSGKSEALIDFVQTKWPVFRKLGIMCVGITNKVEHFTNWPAPSTVWQISGNKVILPLSRESVQEAKEKSLLANPYHLELARSLEKRNGQFSQLLYLGSSFSGTAEYLPTGFDYWPAINEAEDQAVYSFVLTETGDHQSSIFYLAEKYPMGVRSSHGAHRKLDKIEMESIITDIRRH